MFAVGLSKCRHRPASFGRRLFLLVGLAEGIRAAGAVSAIADFDLLSGALVVCGVVIAVVYLAIDSGINRFVIHGSKTLLSVR